MNRAQKHIVVLLTCVVILAFLVILVPRDTGKAYARPSWEYKVLQKFVDERDLNQLGLEGWELVLFRSYDSAPSSGLWVFKRLK